MFEKVFIKRVLLSLFPLTIALFTLYSIFLASNRTPEAEEEQIALKYSFSLEEIKERGKLIAITENNSTGYFLYKSEPMGFEYGLLKRFAASIGVDLEVKVATSLDTMFAKLQRGEADILAANITVTRERLNQFNFSNPIFKTKQVLIQRKPENWRQLPAAEIEASIAKDLNGLEGKKVHVRRNSAFHLTIKKLAESTDSKIKIVEADAGLTVEDIIQKVALGEFDYTIADENIAKVNQAYFPNLDINTLLGPPHKISWATRKNSEDLTTAINEWLQTKEAKHAISVLYKQYFKNVKDATFRVESPFSSASGGRISPYDALIKKYSSQINWDWRLVASLISQESRFNPEAQSPMGAYGLMQLMPDTYLYFLSESEAITPESSIKAGMKYLERREKYWKKYIFDKEERKKFILASYNCGLGHVLDARRLAIKYDRNPNQWEDNVEYFLLHKSQPKYYLDPVVKHGYCRGEEPVNFVKKILARYNHYKNLIPE
jgi:membrane-bound lytic murein transglycosylase F